MSAACTASRTPRDRHPPPCGMDRVSELSLVQQAACLHRRINDLQPVNKPQQATKPYSANWRERRQKARVRAAAYRRSKPLPVWDGPF